jgi:NADPH-dependent 2,4-dienoyl-CoA reductase/sulfur reductase-like enzyme/rhodanese-related sulfurtransferase
MSMKVVIIGGVAGGASTAARARRLSEDASITLIERGPYVSFANCGLPYALGGVIEEEGRLQLQTPASLKARFNIDVLVDTDAVEIDRQARTVRVREANTSRAWTIPYDKLVLATGAEAIRPPMPGIDLPSVFVLQTIPELRAVQNWISENKASSAVIIGGGFIGLEAAENLIKLGMRVTVVERGEQVFAPFDLEMAEVLHREIRAKGVDLRLRTEVKGIRADGPTIVDFGSGESISTDLVILGVGVKPRSALAIAARIETGKFGGVVVNAGMQTSDPDIYAVGDVVEVVQPQLMTPTYVPLAGPANRQGRIAADRIFGRKSAYRGTQGTAVCQIFDLTAGATGLSEKALRRAKRDFSSISIHPADHATYFPGATSITIKLVFDKNDGKVLGAQAVGKKGIDKRIDVFAIAIQAGMTVHDLEEAELAYAPPYGSAKDPVNFSGFVAANVIRGDSECVQAESVQALLDQGAQLIDVRTAREFLNGHIPGAKNIPVDELRARLGEVRPGQRVILYCQVGLRGYIAHRILAQRGFRSANLNGGYASWSNAKNKNEPTEPRPAAESKK